MTNNTYTPARPEGFDYDVAREAACAEIDERIRAMVIAK